jgi:hypothetical protein
MRRFVASIALMVGLAATASSAPVRVEFSGVVAHVSADGSAPPLDPSVHAGTPFTGFFTYDDAATPQLFIPESPHGSPEGGLQPEVSQYAFAAPTYGVELDLGAYSLTGAPSSSLNLPTGGFILGLTDEEVANRDPSSADVFFSPSTVGTGFARIDVQVAIDAESPGLPLHGTGLKGIPWELTDPATGAPIWSGEIALSFVGTTAAWSVLAEVDTLRAVPEPHNGLLFGLTALALAFVRWNARAPRSD